MQSFHELGVSARVSQALAERDIHAPFRIQTLVLPDALAGRDVLAKSPTGSGKTLAFAVPIIERLDAGDPKPSALILVPTRELAAQVAAELETIAPARDLRVAAVYGGVTISTQAKKAREAHVLVATPGRLQDLVDRLGGLLPPRVHRAGHHVPHGAGTIEDEQQLGREALEVVHLPAALPLRLLR